MEASLPNFQPPAKPHNSGLLRALRFWFKPTFIGTKHLSQNEQSALFVGNHTIYGLSDIPILQAELYNKHDIWLRPLADHLHYKVPIWPKYLEAHGGFPGTPELCSAAMNKKENILVFPGGSREAHKRKGEDYKLIWKKRLGFVRMAAQHSYPIQPFASVGADDAWSVLIDSNDWQKGPMRPLLEKTGNFWDKVLKKGAQIPPLARGIGLTNIPRPEPFYFAFGPAIDTSSYKDYVNDEGAMIELRDEVKGSVENLIQQGKSVQSESSFCGLWRQLLRRM